MTSPRAARRLLATLAMLALVACDTADIPDEELRPDIVGVVQSIEQLEGDEFEFLLGSGERVRFNPDDVESIVGGAPVEAELFLYGEAEWGAWYVGLPPRAEDCYALSGPGEIREDRMVFESGISLPLGETFDREFFAHGVGVRGNVCVNASGEVSSATST